MQKIPLTARVYADFDNERPYRHIVGLSQTDTVRRFDGTTQSIGCGDYLHLYMDCGDGEYCISAGIVIANPFPTRPYKWCCVLDEDIRDWQDE